MRFSTVTAKIEDLLRQVDSADVRVPEDSALIGIAVLVGIVHWLKGIGPPDLDRILSLSLFLSPIVPAFTVGYFVYRYSFFRIVVNPAVFYSALTGIVLTVYLLGIRRVAEQWIALVDEA